LFVSDEEASKQRFQILGGEPVEVVDGQVEGFASKFQVKSQLYRVVDQLASGPPAFSFPDFAIVAILIVDRQFREIEGSLD
jgi:hypothetical protein